MNCKARNLLHEQESRHFPPCLVDIADSTRSTQQLYSLFGAAVSQPPTLFFVRKLNKQHCEVVCEPRISSITAFGVHVLQLCCRSLQPHHKVAQVKARRRADLLALVQVRIQMMGSQEGCGRDLGEWVQQNRLSESEMHICSGGSHLPWSAAPASSPCVSTALH